jgi:hypothetical protein
MVRANGKAVGFLGFVIDLTTRMDKTYDQITIALQKLGDDISDQGDRESVQNHLVRFSWYNRKVLYENTANNFLTYVAELFEEIINRHPEILNSNEKISYREIMQFSRYSDLRDYIVEKKIMDLTHQGVDDLRTEILSRYNFDLFPKKNIRKRIAKILERRNLLVHAYGKVNRRYQDRTGDHSCSVGERIRLERPMRMVGFLSRVAYDIDGRARKKFRLKRSKLPYSEIITVGAWLDD